MTPGLTAEECFARNLETRRLWYDLFADDPGEKVLALLAAEEVAEEFVAIMVDLTIIAQDGGEDSDMSVAQSGVFPNGDGQVYAGEDNADEETTDEESFDEEPQRDQPERMGK